MCTLRFHAVSDCHKLTNLTFEPKQLYLVKICTKQPVHGGNGGISMNLSGQCKLCNYNFNVKFGNLKASYNLCACTIWNLWSMYSVFQGSIHCYPGCQRIFWSGLPVVCTLFASVFVSKKQNPVLCRFSFVFQQTKTIPSRSFFYVPTLIVEAASKQIQCHANPLVMSHGQSSIMLFFNCGEVRDYLPCFCTNLNKWPHTAFGQCFHCFSIRIFWHLLALGTEYSKGKGLNNCCRVWFITAVADWSVQQLFNVRDKVIHGAL